MASKIDNNQVATTYTISDLAREFSVTTRAIRFYEDQGLLSPQRDGRKRIYSKRDRTRLKLILRGKRLGFTLSETRELFDLYDTARGEERQLRYFLKILAERRKILEQQQKDIEAVLREIQLAEDDCLRLLAEDQQQAPGAGRGDTPRTTSSRRRPLSPEKVH